MLKGLSLGKLQLKNKGGTLNLFLKCKMTSIINKTRTPKTAVAKGLSSTTMLIYTQSIDLKITNAYIPLRKRKKQKTKFVFSHKKVVFKEIKRGEIK
jgi:hypothetical protein